MAELLIINLSTTRLSMHSWKNPIPDRRSATVRNGSSAASSGFACGFGSVELSALGFNLSETSAELGTKLAITFLPEIAITLLKLPRE